MDDEQIQSLKSRVEDQAAKIHSDDRERELFAIRHGPLEVSIGNPFGGQRKMWPAPSLADCIRAVARHEVPSHVEYHVMEAVGGGAVLMIGRVTPRTRSNDLDPN